MTLRHYAIAAAALSLAACGQSAETKTAANSAAGEAANAQQDADTAEFEAPSGEYAPDPNHAYITFSYLHQGYSYPWLRWGEWTGTLDWNADAPEKSSVSVTIDVASVDSGVEEFDGHLVGENWFNASAYPEITFVSTNVEKTGANTGKITGDLTIKGITKPVTLDVTFRKGAYEERGNVYKLGFSGKTQINRSEWGLGAYVPVVSDEVDIVIETEWTMAAPSDE